MCPNVSVGFVRAVDLPVDVSDAVGALLRNPHDPNPHPRVVKDQGCRARTFDYFGLGDPISFQDMRIDSGGIDGSSVGPTDRRVTSTSPGGKRTCCRAGDRYVAVGVFEDKRREHAHDDQRDSCDGGSQTAFVHNGSRLPRRKSANASSARRDRIASAWVRTTATGPPTSFSAGRSRTMRNVT